MSKKALSILRLLRVSVINVCWIYVYIESINLFPIILFMWFIFVNNKPITYLEYMPFIFIIQLYFICCYWDTIFVSMIMRDNEILACNFLSFFLSSLFMYLYLSAMLWVQERDFPDCSPLWHRSTCLVENVGKIDSYELCIPYTQTI